MTHVVAGVAADAGVLRSPLATVRRILHTGGRGGEARAVAHLPDSVVVADRPPARLDEADRQAGTLRRRNPHALVELTDERGLEIGGNRARKRAGRRSVAGKCKDLDQYVKDHAVDGPNEISVATRVRAVVAGHASRDVADTHDALRGGLARVLCKGGGNVSYPLPQREDLHGSHPVGEKRANVF